MKTVDQVDLTGKRVFVRVDFNTPLAAGPDGKLVVADDTRVREALPTLRYVVEHGGRLVVASHLGRPKGKRDPRMSVAPPVARLAELLGQPVPLVDDLVGPEVEARVDALEPGEALAIENVRFDPGEEKNDAAYAAALARLADVYVNDAFGAAHRAHASTAGMVPLVPVRAAGFLMKKELDYLGKALAEPRRPFVAILGGAKVSDKIGVLERLVQIADSLIVGGAMAYTFLEAQGVPVGESLVEDAHVGQAGRFLATARRRGVTFLLPEDHVIVDRLESPSAVKTTDGPRIPDGWFGVDIGPKTRERFAREIRRGKTVIWNGPMGIFETDAYARGTQVVADAVAEATKAGGTTIVGGGDSVSAARKAGVIPHITHVSTGGGASLEYLEGKVLPGVAALEHGTRR